MQKEELEVLIVEDDAGICCLMEFALQQKNIKSKSISTVFETKAILDTINPMIVFLDFQLPDGSGWDLISYFKKVCPKIRIFLMTGFDNKQLPSLPEAIDGILFKPFKLSDMLRLIPGASQTPGSLEPKITFPTSQ